MIFRSMTDIKGWLKHDNPALSILNLSGPLLLSVLDMAPLTTSDKTVQDHTVLYGKYTVLLQPQ
jgi:hypothetical protein